jgi:hypothetical protein
VPALTAHDGVLTNYIIRLGLPGGMDGFAVARACRAETCTWWLPRVTALRGITRTARIAGFDYLMAKPLTEECLCMLLR